MLIEKHIELALKEACSHLGIEPPEVLLEISRQPEFGDLTSNLALAIAKTAGMDPRKLAQEIAEQISTSDDAVSKVEIAGPGFINFHLGMGCLKTMLTGLVQAPGGFGASEEGKDEQWLFEFVSANPTGPLNVVSARAACVGDSLVRIFNKRGYRAHSEYYVNDTGGQIRNLGGSVRARIAELQGLAESAVIPEGGYHGDYVRDLARRWLDIHSGQTVPNDHEMGRWAADLIRERQERTLTDFRVAFQRWFRESELYGADHVPQAFHLLESEELTYSSDGAVYFQASRFGDSEDRVVKTSDGRFTYVVPDIAYHLDKHRRGYRKAVTILGPDHHGHIAQLKAALRAVKLPDDFFHPLMIQQVNLRRGGEEVKMSKRAGVGIMLDELIQEVGVDAARFFFLMRRSSSHLDFDMDLARKHSDDNPVFYVQYGHARIRSIFRQPDAADPKPDADLSLLKESEEISLLRHLARFSWTLETAVRGLEPHPLTTYLIELARGFHLFYQRHRIITPDRDLTAARLTLCQGVASVLKEGLNLIGVEAPERM